MSVRQLIERLPAKSLATRSPIEPRMPEPRDVSVEPPHAAVVRRPPVVLVVASEFGVERRRLILDRIVPMPLAPLRHRLQTPPKAFAHRPNVNRELPPSAARTDVREAEKVEGRRFRRIGLRRT
jgi:hypothetical protein